MQKLRITIVIPLFLLSVAWAVALAHSEGPPHEEPAPTQVDRTAELPAAGIGFAVGLAVGIIATKFIFNKGAKVPT